MTKPKTWASVLERLSADEVGFQSVHATVSLWKDRRLAQRAQQSGELACGRPKDRFTGEDSSSAIAESKFHVLMTDRAMRIEERQLINGCEQTSVSVVSGDSVWVKSSQHKDVVRTGGRYSIEPHSIWDAERLFRPQHQHDIIQGLVLRETGTVRIAGRGCVRLHGVWAPDVIAWPHFLPFNADSYEICADLERGAFVSIVGYLAHEAFERIEVQEIVFDGEFDPTLFELRLEPGQLVEHTESEHPAGRDCHPGDIQFPLFVPGPTMMKHLSQEWCRSSHTEHGVEVKLLYRTLPGGPKWDPVYIHERTADDDDSLYEWESVTIEGLDCMISEPEYAEGTRIVRLRKDATRIEIYSRKPIDWIARLAKSLVPFVDDRPFPF